MQRWITLDGSVELHDDHIMVWFDRGSGRRHKKLYSPRRFPLTAVQDVEARTSWRHNCFVVTLELVGATAPAPGPRYDPNSFLVNVGQWRQIAKALRVAVLSAQPKSPAPHLLGDAIASDTSAANSPPPRIGPEGMAVGEEPLSQQATVSRKNAEKPSDNASVGPLPPLELPHPDR